MTAYNKILWSIVSNAFWRSANIIPVNIPLSNSFKSYLLGKTDKKFVDWFGPNPDLVQLFDHELPFKWS